MSIPERASADWAPIAAPGILWVNGVMLLAGSATLEIARRRLRGSMGPAASNAGHPSDGTQVVVVGFIAVIIGIT